MRGRLCAPPWYELLWRGRASDLDHSGETKTWRERLGLPGNVASLAFLLPGFKHIYNVRPSPLLRSLTHERPPTSVSDPHMGNFD